MRACVRVCVLLHVLNAFRGGCSLILMSYIYDHAFIGGGESESRFDSDHDMRRTANGWLGKWWS
jgi:hypothetical protein